MHNQSNRPMDWMDEIVKRYENKLFRTALAVVGNNADAEDIVQEVFVKLFQKQPTFESTNHEMAWLIRVTVNQSKNYLRSHWWKKAIPLLDTHPAPEGEQHNTMQAVFALPSKYRAVIHLSLLRRLCDKRDSPDNAAKRIHGKAAPYPRTA